jgi:uncharacterized protein (DUF362 family)
LSRVAVIKGSRGHEPVFKALDLVDFQKVLKGWDRVLIKVNFITTRTWDSGATTDPVVVEAILQRLKDLSVETLVVESDATMTDATKAFKSTGMAEMCDQNSVEWINLRHLKEKVEIPVKDGETLKRITVPRIVTDSAVISAAKLKTHSGTTVTLGMKNMFGLLPDKFKAKYHAQGISKVIVDINSVLKPTLTVVDGFVGMEGSGPSQGDPVQMDTIIAGADPVATDATAARIMGFDPHTIKHIRRAHEKGIGEIDDIEVVGDSIEAVSRIFKRA